MLRPPHPIYLTIIHLSIHVSLFCSAYLLERKLKLATSKSEKKRSYSPDTTSRSSSSFIPAIYQHLLAHRPSHPRSRCYGSNDATAHASLKCQENSQGRKWRNYETRKGNMANKKTRNSKYKNSSGGAILPNPSILPQCCSVSSKFGGLRMPSVFFKRIRNERCCMYQGKKIPPTRQEIAERDRSCEPRPPYQAEDPTDPMPHAPFAMHRSQYQGFLFLSCFANQSDRKNIENQIVKLRCCRCHAVPIASSPDLIRV